MRRPWMRWAAATIGMAGLLAGALPVVAAAKLTAREIVATGLLRDESAHVTLHGESSSPGDAITFSIDAPASGSVVLGDLITCTGSDQTTCEQDLSYLPDPAVTDPVVFTYRAVGADATSESATISMTFQADNVPPELELNVPAKTRTASVAIVADAYDPAGIAAFRISNTGTVADGVLVTATELAGDPTDGGRHLAVTWQLENETGGSTMPGRHTIWIQARDAVGNWSPVVEPRVFLDGGAPTVSAVTFGLGVGYDDTRVPLRLRVVASDPEKSPIVRQCQIRRDGKSWTSLPCAATQKLWVARGHTYQVRARAVDAGGNKSPWVTTRSFRALRTRHTSHAIAYAGTWYTWIVPSTHWSDDKGASATLRFTGRTVGVQMWDLRQGGRAAIYLDGTLAKTVLARGSREEMRLAFQKTWPTRGHHTIRIVVVNSGLVNLNAIDVLD